MSNLTIKLNYNEKSQTIMSLVLTSFMLLLRRSSTVTLYCPNGIAFRMVAEGILGSAPIGKCSSILNGIVVQKKTVSLQCLQNLNSVLGERFEVLYIL